MIRSWLYGSVLAAMLALVPGIAPAQESGDVPALPAEGPNVGVTITLGDVEETGTVTRTYRLVARDRSRASMLMGWRTPIPVQRSVDEVGGNPITSFSYQNVGMSAELEAIVLSPERVNLKGQLELSGKRDGAPQSAATGESEMPLIGTFQQALSVTLRPGTPLRVAEVPDPEGGSLYVEITVEILD